MMNSTSLAEQVQQGHSNPAINTTDYQSDTLGSLCEWWSTSKKELLPGICHWFVDPQKTQQRFSARLNQDQKSDIDLYLTSKNTTNDVVGLIDRSVPSTVNLSFIFIISGFLFFFLISLFIICITYRKRTQISNQDDYVSREVSNQLDRIRSANILHMRLHGTKKKDLPPDYTTVVNMKIREDEDLPTYSEAVAVENKDKIRFEDENVEHKTDSKD